MHRSSISRAAGVASAVLLAAATASLAQTTTGSITGTVTDPSGAVIPNASVTAVNTATGVRTPVTSDDAGSFTVRFLPIGPYKIEATAPGFNTVTTSQFALEINQTAKINPHLAVGASTNVEVQGSLAPILDTADATLGLSLNSNEIAAIPLNGRNFSSLTLFQPGAVNTDPTGLTGSNGTERNTYNSGVVTINGNRAQSNNYTLDGIDINETQNNLIGYNVSPDAIGEIRVISANAPAEYGNVNGGDIVTVLKSGTNKFHGSAYEYLENQNITANSWANNFSGAGQTPFTQSLFGGTLGGPIFRDKLFFFVDYTGTRRHQGGFASASVLTAAQRQGDFSQLLSLQPSIQLVDPFNNYAPFVNNQIPVNNPVVRYLAAHPEYYPLPNHTPTDTLIQNNFRGPTSAFTNNDQGDVKIEWDPRPADKFTAFYSQGTGYDASISPIPVTFPSSNRYPDHLGGATWVRTFSPAVVNEVRFGFTRIRWDNSIPTDTTGAFGLNGDSVVGIPTPAPQQFAGFTYQGVGSSTLTDVGVPGQAQVIRDNTYSLSDTLTYQRGKHLFSLGGQVLRYQQNFANYGNGGQLGTYSFSGANSALPSASNVYGPADWLLDRANQQTISLANGFFGERQYRVAGFAEDDWKVTNKLTLNLGVRYEFDSPYTEVNNQTANVILSGPLKGTVEYAKHLPGNALPGSIVCDNPACYQPNYNQWQPRIGFAYQANPRVVFRGGYGTTSYLEGNSTGERLINNPPFSNFAQLNATAPSSLTNPGNFYAETDGFAVGAGSQNVAGLTAYPQNMQPAYIQEFNFNTEIQLNNTTSAQLGYIGEIGHRLIDFRNANQLTTAQAASIAALPADAALPAEDVAPFAGLVGQGGALFLIEPEGISTYNALQVTVRHRLSKGFQSTVNYTWSKALTDTNGNYGASNSPGPNGIQDGYNLRGDYGPSELDVRHNLSANGSYSIPFGRGQLFGANTNRALDLLAGGWTVSSTAIVYSGLPITIGSNPNNNTNSYGNSFGGARANRYRRLNIVNRSTAHWFGTDPSATPCTGADNGICAYGPQLANTFGTAGVGTERTAGFEQVDSSLFKDFHITESQAVGFRADAFNVMNLVSYGNPDRNVNDNNTFGQITSSRNGPRTIQFSAHYSF